MTWARWLDINGLLPLGFEDLLDCQSHRILYVVSNLIESILLALVILLSFGLLNYLL